MRGSLGNAEAWTAQRRFDATPLDLCAAGSGAGPRRLPRGGRTQPGGAVGHAVAGGGGRRCAGCLVLITIAATRPQARDEGEGGQAAAETARGAELLPGPGERPVSLGHP